MFKANDVAKKMVITIRLMAGHNDLIQGILRVKGQAI